MASRIELEAEHARAIAKLTSDRDGALRAAEDSIREARERHDREAAALRADHAAELERRFVKCQRAFDKALRPLIDAFRKEDTRACAGQIASAYREQNARLQDQCGAEIGPWDLAAIFQAAIVDERPEVLSVWVRPDSRHFTAPAADVGHSGIELHRLIVANADVAAIRECLLRIEAAVARLGATAVHPPSEDAAERFEALRFGGSPTAIGGPSGRVGRCRRPCSLRSCQCDRLRKPPSSRRGAGRRVALADRNGRVRMSTLGSSVCAGTPIPARSRARPILRSRWGLAAWCCDPVP